MVTQYNAWPCPACGARVTDLARPEALAPEHRVCERCWRAATSARFAARKAELAAAGRDGGITAVTVPEVYTVDDLRAVLALLEKNIIAAMRAGQDWALRTLTIEALDDYCSYRQTASRRALGAALIDSIKRQTGADWWALTGDAARAVVRRARTESERTWQ